MTKSDDGIQARMPGVPGVVLFDLFFRHFIENKIKRRDIGVIPLLFSFPFMFYPKVLSGDTQLWILSAALIVFLTFRTDQFFNKRDGVLVVLSILSILAYAFRSALGLELLRHIYTYLAFLIFWIVCGRENSEYFPAAVKATVVVWFGVGLYQYVAIAMGFQIEPFGRYVEGRSGVPGLTAEPSYYGSISVLHLMYLLSQKNKKNTFYIACAVASVALSGSMLAMLLLIFPLLRLPPTPRIGVLVAVPLLVVSDFYITSAGLTARLSDVASGGSDLSTLLLDASLNLRVGNLYFTLVENLIPSLLLFGPIDFMAQYNEFALNSGVFMSGVESNYILPAIGEMLYGAGVFGVALLAIFLNRAQEKCATNKTKIERIAFIVACMLGPISISNIFLILYAQSKE